MTTGTEHTPGPWRLQHTARDCMHIFVDAPVGVKILATVECGFKEPFESQQTANAILMLHAPELLALARKYASECIECGGSAEGIRGHGSEPEDEYSEPCEACAHIWAVINKAEGRQPEVEYPNEASMIRDNGDAP